MQNRWVRLVLLLSVAALLASAFTSCAVWCNLWYFGCKEKQIQPPHLPAFDSVSISTLLNDTVFTLDECTEYIDWLANVTERWDGANNPPPHVPKLRMTVHNASSQDLQFMSSVNESDNAVSLLGPVPGTGARIEAGVSDLDFKVFDPATMHCSIVRARDSLLLESPIFSPLYSSHVTRIWPGKYWVVLECFVYPWEIKEPPVWFGSVRSDTVYFQVVELK